MPGIIRKPCHMELNGLGNRPQHAAALGVLVGTSGRLEGSLGWLLAFFSGGSAAITVPMFQAVVSTDAQRAMLEAAAAKALSGPELEEFEALMEDFRPRYRERSRLVHNVWGYSNDHPDKALWCPASEVSAFMARVAVAKNPSEIEAIPSGDLSLRCVTYTVQDITDVGTRLDHYTTRVLRFLEDLMANHPALAVQASAPPEPSRAGELPLETQPNPQSGQTG